MKRPTGSEPYDKFQNLVQQRWEDLNDQAERILGRARDVPEATWDRLGPYVEQLQQTRDEMAERLEALKQTSQEQFDTLRSDTERVTEDLRQTVHQLREKTQEALRRR